MDNDKRLTVNEVFKAQGQPTITYVAREEGAYERRLSEAIKNRGTVCLLTGPSKTGKTTLYTKVADSLGLTVVKVRCYKELSAKGVWRKALEDVNFERLSEQQSKTHHSVGTEGEVGGFFWLGLASWTDRQGRCKSGQGSGGR